MCSLSKFLLLPQLRGEGADGEAEGGGDGGEDACSVGVAFGQGGVDGERQGAGDAGGVPGDHEGGPEVAQGAGEGEGEARDQAGAGQGQEDVAAQRPEARAVEAGRTDDFGVNGGQRDAGLGHEQRQGNQAGGDGGSLPGEDQRVMDALQPRSQRPAPPQHDQQQVAQHGGGQDQWEQDQAVQKAPARQPGPGQRVGQRQAERDAAQRGPRSDFERQPEGGPVQS